MTHLSLRWLTAWGIVSCAAISCAAAQTPQYHWTAGQTATYNVRLEAEETGYNDVLEGNVTYTVQPKGNGAVLHPQGTLEGHQTLDNGGTLTKPKPSRLAHLGLGSPDARDVAIDDSGAVPSSADGPSSLGQISRLVFDRVGEDQKNWVVDNDCSILIQPLPGAASTAVKPLPAHETIAYTVRSTHEGLSTVDRHYELKTKELVHGAPRVEIVSDGVVEFDAVTGLPFVSTWDGTLTSRSTAGGEKIPLHAAVYLAEQPLNKSDNLTQLSEYDELACIAELKSADHNKQSDAVHRLQGKQPDAKHCAEISRRLVALLHDPDLFMRWGAVDALHFWATTSSVPSLLSAMTEPEHAVRWAALGALPDLHDPRIPTPLAARLTSEDGGFAATALKKYGPDVEDAVIPYLKNPEWTVRGNAADILKTVGTKKSLPALKDAVINDNGIPRTGEVAAIIAIREREGMPPDPDLQTPAQGFPPGVGGFPPGGFPPGAGFPPGGAPPDGAPPPTGKGVGA